MGKDADFIGKYFAIMEFLTIPIIIVIGVYDDGRHVMLTMYNFDENAEGDFKELYSKHKKLHPSEPAEIPIKPKNLRKDRNPNLVFKSSLYGKSI